MDWNGRARFWKFKTTDTHTRLKLCVHLIKSELAVKAYIFSLYPSIPNNTTCRLYFIFPCTFATSYVLLPSDQTALTHPCKLSPTQSVTRLSPCLQRSKMGPIFLLSVSSLMAIFKPKPSVSDRCSTLDEIVRNFHDMYETKTYDSYWILNRRPIHNNSNR